MSKQNKAFTLLEAVMVIVLIGILATVAIPRLQTDTTQEAADQILSDIRYTQHLALTDSVTNTNNAKWQSAFWSIRFQNTTDGSGAWAYTVASDKSYEGNFALNEAALDELSGLPLYGNTSDGNSASSPRVFITKKYGISNVDFSSCGNKQYIGFDHLGRLHQGHLGSTTPDYASVLHTPCIITFTHPNGNFSINIQPETGYAYIVGQENQ